MKLKIITALAAALVLMSGGTVAFGEGGGVIVFAPRIFSDNDNQNVLPSPYPYTGSPTKDVQLELTRLGYYHGPIDGNVSPGSWTSAAIAIYQRSHGMPATGAIDGALVASLLNGR